MANEIVNGTPVKAVASTVKRYAQIEPSARQQQQDYCYDMLGHWIGPCEPREFLAKFMAPAADPTPAATFRLPRRTTTERQMYRSFVGP